MKKVLSDVSDEMLETMFFKVNSDGNGFITWVRRCPCCLRRHGCEIVKVEFLIQWFKKITRFLTVTKDGGLQFWTESLLISSFRLSQAQQPHSQEMWVIDLVCLHNMNLIAVSSTELKIAFTFTELDSYVLVMGYWSDYHKGVFCLGDTKGNVIIFTSDNVANGLFNPRILPRPSKWDHWVSVSMQKLLNEKSILYRSYWLLPALHTSWCQLVKFVPQLNMVVSCSAVEKSSMVLIMLPAKDPEKLKDSSSSSAMFSIVTTSMPGPPGDWEGAHSGNFSGKQFALGNYPITSVYFNTKGNTLICSTYSIGILKGYLEAHGPMKSGKTTTHNSALCAVLYSKIFKQVVSGCQQGTVSVWEIMTGRKMMEFSVSGAQLVELTAMALDVNEPCLLMGLLDGTMKMWNYNTGECLLTFPNPDQVEISGIVHMNKAYYMTGWSKRITNFITRDILFWNVNMLKPILNFNASMSPLPLQPVKVQEAEECVDSSQGPSKTCMKKMWAHKASTRLPGPGWRTVGKISLRRSLMSAPVGMKHSGSKEPQRPLSQQAWLSFQISFSTGRSKLSTRSLDKWSFYRQTEIRRKESQKKMLLQPNALVEKVGHAQPWCGESCCIDGYIYAWSIHGNGGLLGKFSVDLEDNGDIVGTMATDKNDWILITGDCKGLIKIWDIKDYCTFVGYRPPQPSGVKIPTETENKFRFLITNRLQTSIPYYIPLQEMEVVNGQTISLVSPKLLITWKGHLESVADILYVDSLQLIISAGQDWDVKAWKLSDDATGTFGLSVWKRIQSATMDGDQEQSASLEEKAYSTSTVLRGSCLELQRDLAEALAYHQWEQVALMTLLNGKEDMEAEAWTRLQRIAQMSPWAHEHSLEDIEASWSQWESRGRQVSKVVGTAYKPKGGLRSPRVLSTNVNYSCMKQQISPQVYQSLYFNKLTPVQQPDFLMHRAPDQQG
ncbi:WD repeat-containing protein on Y chromosome [Heterocephalus glaber]|uniref:WD repeat-containing protein on Y chromosome n=1 Tax=Heterocephalus glaber TaxID=10181 RepID=G5BPW2_HETGA|nr:WD repeat-containing protein on Y chromosome [Heterocephalus glaber]